MLDPACGSGNFLYLSLLALKDLELRVAVEAEALGLEPGFPAVGPEAVLGIEINPYAAELARVSVWIGHIQWARRNGYPPPHDPVLRPLDTIECRDAVLDAEGRPATWPAADVIIGNPPFLGGKLMRRTLGDAWCDALFAAYAGLVPAEADLVCYWFAKALQAIEAGRTARAGLVATNSIRGGANRLVLDRIAERGTIIAAWSDEPWTLDGAAVRVSLVAFAGPAARDGPRMLDGTPVARIFTDLTATPGLDMTRARRLAENAGLAFMGVTPAGPFDVPGETARGWLLEPTNPNGRTNAAVVRPYVNAMDLTRRSADRWIVDFGVNMPERDAAMFVAPFAHASKNVKPVRMKSTRPEYRDPWWQHTRPRPTMRAAIGSKTRYIATPMVAKHRIFAWLPAAALPANLINAIARDDDTTFGILHSRFHEAWALRTGTTLEDRPRYTPTTTFETFPFPEGLTPDRPASACAADPRARRIAEAARALVAARDRWLNPPELVDRVPEVVPGFPDRLVPKNDEAAAALKKRTLTALYNTRGTPEGAWLDALHADLDAAVAAAYDWPADITTEDALARLLALNEARAAAAGNAGSTAEPDGGAREG